MVALDADTYPWATDPFAHQRTIWVDTVHREGYALHLDMGTGKAKIGIDTAAALFLEGAIKRMLVVAPNEVHANWVTDEIPAHMPREVRALGLIYNARNAGAKKTQKAIDELLAHDGLAILAITYDGIKTEAGEKLAEKFVKLPTLMICDESQRIKNPKAQQTKACRRIGKSATYRRTMTGTPMAKDPLDYYSQIAFVNPKFWQEKGFRTYTEFKNEFAIMQMQGWSKWPQVTGFRQLDTLNAMLAEISVRVRKEEVLDLPPKLYTKLGFDLTPGQQRVYHQLVDEYRAELDSGLVINAAMAAVRLTRLHQVSCNYLPTDEDGHYEAISDVNPRLRLLIDRLEDCPGQSIVWHRFREDGRLIAEAIRKADMSCARFDGTVSHGDRERGMQSFREGDVQFLVANAATIGVGVTLVNATSAFYYSLSHNYEHRVQSEDRCHRIGQLSSVLYTDLVGRGTVDEKIVENLLRKQDTAAVVNGDVWSEWIR